MRANRVIDVIAVTTAKGEYMTTSTTEDRTAHCDWGREGGSWGVGDFIGD